MGDVQREDKRKLCGERIKVRKMGNTQREDKFEKSVGVGEK